MRFNPSLGAFGNLSLPPLERITADKPDKGQLDGSCNRTACQKPLAGRPQFFMDGNLTGGPRLHYCPECEAMFSDYDRRCGQPLRCTPVEDRP